MFITETIRIVSWIGICIALAINSQAMATGRAVTLFGDYDIVVEYRTPNGIFLTQGQYIEQETGRRTEASLRLPSGTTGVYSARVRHALPQTVCRIIHEGRNFRESIPFGLVETPVMFVPRLTDAILIRCAIEQQGNARRRGQ